MRKEFLIVAFAIIVTACSNANVQENSELYTISDVKTMTILRYLSEENASSLSYFENLIVPQMMKIEDHAILFEEVSYESKCNLLFAIQEPVNMPCGIRAIGFRITVDKNGIMYYNGNKYNPVQLAIKYYDYYICDDPNISELFECSDKKIVELPKMGRFEKSLGFFDLRISLPDTQNEAINIIRSFRAFTRTLFFNLYKYRNELSYKLFDQSFIELNNTDKLEIIQLSDFYSEIYFVHNNNQNKHQCL